MPKVIPAEEMATQFEAGEESVTVDDSEMFAEDNSSDSWDTSDDSTLFEDDYMDEEDGLAGGRDYEEEDNLSDRKNSSTRRHYYEDDEDDEDYEYIGDDDDPERPNYEDDDNYEDDEETDLRNVKLGNGYAGVECKDWTQKMSRHAAICLSGCRIVSFSRMLYMAGFTEVGDPDKYFEWGRSVGLFLEGGAEATPMGSSLFAFVKGHGGRAEIIAEYKIDGFRTVDQDAVMNYLRNGYFVMIWGKDHQTMFSNEESIRKGKLVICDTYTFSGDYAYGANRNYMELSDYGRENQSKYFDKISVFMIKKNDQNNDESANQNFASGDSSDDIWWLDDDSGYAVYDINYGLDGGVNGFNPSKYSYGDEFTFKAAVKDGYRFKGWYLDSDFQNEITGIDYNSRGNLTVYAKWEPVDPNQERYVLVKDGIMVEVDANFMSEEAEEHRRNMVKKRVTFFAFVFGATGLIGLKIVLNYRKNKRYQPDVDKDNNKQI